MVALETYVQFIFIGLTLFLTFLTFNVNWSIMQIIALPLLGLGVFLWIYSWRYMGKAWGLENNPKGDLITSGPYKIVRHPLYFGGIIALFSISFLSSSFLPFITAVFFVFITAVRAQKEEAFMKEKFGSKWDSYAKKTGFLFPKLISKKK